jgi:hypothetical protein
MQAVAKKPSLRNTAKSAVIPAPDDGSNPAMVKRTLKHTPPARTASVQETTKIKLSGNLAGDAARTSQKFLVKARIRELCVTPCPNSLIKLSPALQPPEASKSWQMFDLCRLGRENKGHEA